MSKYIDLSPQIYRQRLVVEGFPEKLITNTTIVDYLSKLSDVLKMRALMTPITHRSDKFGECGWIHWETSGAHFYAWEQPHLFFSADIYTCKQFNPTDAVEFTRSYFNSSKLSFKEF
jgi:hypothetical protein